MSEDKGITEGLLMYGPPLEKILKFDPEGQKDSLWGKHRTYRNLIIHALRLMRGPDLDQCSTAAMHLKRSIVGTARVLLFGKGMAHLFGTVPSPKTYKEFFAKVKAQGETSNGFRGTWPDRIIASMYGRPDSTATPVGDPTVEEIETYMAKNHHFKTAAFRFMTSVSTAIKEGIIEVTD